jgi:hypothetical protein
MIRQVHGNPAAEFDQAAHLRVPLYSSIQIGIWDADKISRPKSQNSKSGAEDSIHIDIAKLSAGRIRLRSVVSG